MEQKFNEAQQELVDRFKMKLMKVADETLSNMYTEVCNYAATDAHVNYHQFLRAEFTSALKQQITVEPGHYSWACNIRMELLKQHPEQLRNTIITDLEARIKTLEDHIEDMRKWR